MGEGLLRIGELAERAGVSTRTVDFYTGLGLLVPARRTGGNFRLYQPGDVDRIRLIRHLEAQGIRLEDIARALMPASDQERDGPASPDAEVDGGQDAFREHLASLQEHVQALQNVAEVADPRTRGLLATLTARAQALIATAVVLGAELASEIDHLPPL